MHNTAREENSTVMPGLGINRALAGRYVLCFAPTTQHERTDNMLACAQMYGVNTSPQPNDSAHEYSNARTQHNQSCTAQEGIAGAHTMNSVHLLSVN